MIDNNIIGENIKSLIYNIGDELMKYINDLEVSNIILNIDNKLWIKKANYKINGGLINNNHALNILQKIANLNNKVINSKQPRIATQLDLPISNNQIRKIRVQGFIPPVVNNPSFTFRLH